MLSRKELETDNGSEGNISLAFASTWARAPSAELLAISASPLSVRVAKVSIKASMTSKSSLEIVVSAVAG